MIKRYIPKVGEKIYYVSEYSLKIIPTTVEQIYGKNKSLSLRVEEFLSYAGVRDDYFKDYTDACLRLKYYINLKKTELVKELYEKLLELDKQYEKI